MTDGQLYNVMLALQLSCNRSHGTARRRRQEWYCFAYRVLKVEADLRGVPVPTAPFHSSSLPPFAL
jgi:competence protein ComGF